jgi:GTPase SAR1 family protein
VTSHQSFLDVEKWVENVETHAPDPKLVFLIGAHIDDEREVTWDQGKTASLKYGFHYEEVSSKTGENVEDMFFSLIQEAYRIMIDSGVVPIPEFKKATVGPPSPSPKKKTKTKNGKKSWWSWLVGK